MYGTFDNLLDDLSFVGALVFESVRFPHNVVEPSTNRGVMDVDKNSDLPKTSEDGVHVKSNFSTIERKHFTLMKREKMSVAQLT